MHTTSGKYQKHALKIKTVKREKNVFVTNTAHALTFISFFPRLSYVGRKTEYVKKNILEII